MLQLCASSTLIDMLSLVASIPCKFCLVVSSPHAVFMICCLSLFCVRLICTNLHQGVFPSIYFSLNHLYLAPHICVGEHGQNGFSWGLVACFVTKSLIEPMLTKYELNSWEHISLKFELTCKTFDYENVFENVVYEMAAIFIGEISLENKTNGLQNFNNSAYVVNTGEYSGQVGPGDSHVMLGIDTDQSRSTGHYWRPANVGSAQWNLLQSSSCCLQVRSLKNP